jgi:hypothetical protein
MKNITFSADEDLVEQARETLRQKGMTLNQAVRQWLASYGSGEWVDDASRSIRVARAAFDAATRRGLSEGRTGGESHEELHVQLR